MRSLGKKLRRLGRERRTQPGSFRLDRARITAGLVLGLLGLMAARAATLALFPAQSSALQHIAGNQYQHEVALAPYRGSIFDHRGEALAISVKRTSLAVNPRSFRPTANEVSRLAHILRLPPQRIRSLIGHRGYFAWLARRLEPKTINQVMNMGLSGVTTISEPARYYPAGSAAAQLLGFTDMDNGGLAGIERQFNSDLMGQHLKITASKDAHGNFIFNAAAGAAPEKTGSSLYLTIDKVIQEIAEDELAAGVRLTGAKRAFAVVSDPHTGRLLAVANIPTFDPNDIRRIRIQDVRNGALVDAFEPGSVVKPFILAAAIERRVTWPEEVHDCDGGALKIGKHTIHDTHGADQLTTADALIRSSNICTYKIAMKLGREATHQALDSFGIGHRGSVLGFPGEVGGRLSDWQQWANIRFANVAFGHGFMTTGLELAQAMGAIANGGHLMLPTLVGRVVSGDGVVVRSAPTQIVRDVTSPATARVMRSLLARVVTDPKGTGAKARSSTYTTAGKTGTAQKVEPGERGYAKGKYIASFVGFAPVTDPHLVIYVMIDEPGEKHYYGGDAAAPVFARIAERSLRYLNVAPDIPTTSVPTPAGKEKAPTAKAPTTGHGPIPHRL